MRFSWLPGGFAAAAVIVIGKILAATTSSTPLEFAVYDRAQRSSATPPSADIVMVDIDSASVAEFGGWPWPHAVHASLVERLQTHGARLIAFTTPFGTAQSRSEMERALELLKASQFDNSEQARQLRALLNSSGGGDPETRLAKAIATHGNVVLPLSVRLEGTGDEPAGLPPHLLIAADETIRLRAESATAVQPPNASLAKAASAIGHLYFAADGDGVLRTDFALMHLGGALVPSMATAIASRALDLKAQKLSIDSADALRIAEHKVLLDSQLRIRPQYFSATPADGRTTAQFPRYSYRQVLAGEVPPEQLRDKIVLVGFADPDTTFATPISDRSSALLVIASTVSSLLDSTLYTRPTSIKIVEWLAIVGVILVAAFALPALGLRFGTVIAVLVIAILASTEIGMLGSKRIWAQFMVPTTAMLVGFGMYVLGEMIRRATMKAVAAKDPSASLRALGQTFQKQGQLDLAFETYRRCPLDAPTMELLYYLGIDFERRRQDQKAAAVYSHIATRDQNYRDLRTRRARLKSGSPTRETPAELPATRPSALAATRRTAEDEEPPASAPAPKRGPGRTLGRYEIERELGKGAMGVVYLGRDPKINRVVAIKAIPLAQEFSEEDLAEARARFFREAEMAGRLNHPAIVTVYDAGEDEGLAYIAMEYLRGQHLSYFTDSSRLMPPETVMSLVARTADALHYAHRQNVVHRDIKPANIMFNPETDELKITDFGIARLTDTSRTKTGIVLGTPSFMSPEQLEGRNLDGRSDQFALGVSLYHLLTAQLPFRGDSMPKLMQKIATEPHTPIRLVRPELPPQIDAIIDRMLAKSADDRYPTCAEVAVDLRACAQSIQSSRPAKSEHEWLIP